MKLFKNELTPPIAAISVMLAAGAAFGGDGAALTSKAYVHKGLVALYDGVENYGRGSWHESPDHWANLVDSVLGVTDIEYGCTSDGSLPIWDNNHLVLSGSAGKKNWAHGVSDVFRQAIVNRSATADYCFAGGWNSPFYAGKGTRMILNQTLPGNMLGLLVLHTSVPESSYLPQPNTTLKSFTVRVSDKASMFTNAVPILTDGTITTSTPQGEPDFWLGISPQNTSVNGSGTSWWGCGGNYYGLRLYTRALTDAEIAWNHKVDEVRFMGGTWTGRGVSVLYDPVEVGTPSPDYGAFLSDKTSEDFSIAFEKTVYDDGVEALAVKDGIRCQYADAEVQVGDGEPVVKTGTSFTQELADDTVTAVTWRFADVQYRVVADVLDAETVRVNGELCCTNWPTRGGTLTLTATSSIGAKFETWLGDTNGIENVTSATISVPADRVRNLTAKFGAVVVGWSYDSDAKTIADGNWVINVTEVTDGLSIKSIADGEGVLDLTNFESESQCGKRVTAIGGNAKLGGYEKLTAFIGPDIVRLGDSAFGVWSGGTNYGKITRIVLSDAVSSIGDWAFYRQTSLTSLYPMTFTNVTQLGSYYGTTFNYCTVLAGCLSFPNVTKSGSGSGYQNFSQCKALQEVRLPKLKAIQRYEFAESSAITNVVLSPEIEFLGYGAFRNCSKLTCLTPTNFTTVTSCGEYNDYGVFQGCSSLNLPLAFPKLTVIPQEMFKSCTSLMSVSVPAATEVRKKAFYYIAPGSTIRIGRKQAPVFGENAVASKSGAFPRVVTRGGSGDAGWRALTAPNAAAFEEYRTTKDDYPGALTFGLMNSGGWSWVIDDAPGLMLLIR